MSFSVYQMDMGILCIILGTNQAVGSNAELSEAKKTF